METSAMTLSRVESDDPTLTELRLCSFISGTGFHCDLARLGEAIGGNTNLWMLRIDMFRGTRALEDMATNIGFLNGLRRNNSIRSLHLVGFNRRVGHEMLNGFVVNISNLERITLYGYDLENGGVSVLTSSCTNLSHIRIFNCNVGDAIIGELVSGIRGLRQLCELDLIHNTFGRAGCDAIATLLRDSNCNLTQLGLQENRIDNVSLTVLANSLKGNSKLQFLGLACNSEITGNGWDALSQVLCDTSTANATYSSNHTLRNLGYGILIPNSISSLLELNCGDDKKRVAMQKILRHHEHLNMEPFHQEWELKMLPRVVSWFDRARDDELNVESSVGSKKLSAIYQFVRALPMDFIPSANKVTKQSTANSAGKQSTDDSAGKVGFDKRVSAQDIRLRSYNIHL